MDLTTTGVLLAGLMSFLSPCVLPIVPFYLSYLAGIEVRGLADDTEFSGQTQWRVIFGAICFALGVITIFVGLGSVATVFGDILRDYFDVLRWVGASIILSFGLHFLGVFYLLPLGREWRLDVGRSTSLGPVGAYVLGLAFAFGWTPCVGPVLATILFTAAGQDSLSEGAKLLFLYGVGMTLPFVMAAAFVGPFLRWMIRLRRHLPKIEKVMGLMLVVFAVLIATDTTSVIANWMLQTVPAFSDLG